MKPFTFVLLTITLALTLVFLEQRCPSTSSRIVQPDRRRGGPTAPCRGRVCLGGTIPGYR